MISESENEGQQLLETHAEEASPVASRNEDERANVPVSVVTERFLRAILDKVPLERIEELHLFSPLRQGTIETGIAVVAARTFVISDAVVSARDIVEQLVTAPAQHADQRTPAIADADEILEILEEERAHVDDENMVEHEREDETGDVESTEFESVIAPDSTVVADEESPYADEPVRLRLVKDADFVAAEGDDSAIAASEGAGDDERDNDDDETTLSVAEFDSTDVEMTLSELDVDLAEDPSVPAPARHTVYTARYRLIVKGPERGKWEIEVVDEADAPLLTVETVVRGVQRRAGEETATIRYDGAQLARALRLPVPG